MKSKLWGSWNESHVDDSLLLLLADGAVRRKQGCRARRHLDQCLECRTRMAETEAAFEEIAAARRRAIDRAIPPAEQARQKFAIGLSAVARSRQETRLGRMFTGFPSLLRPAYLTSGVAVATAIVFFTVTVFTPLVSAEELLSRATVAENDRVNRERHLRIRVAGEEFRRSYILGAWDSDAREDRARNIFVTARLDWADPLSAGRFGAWRTALKNARDTVARSNDRLTLRTVPADADPVREASLTVARNTWLPVSETIILRDGRSVEVSEIEIKPEASNKEAPSNGENPAHAEPVATAPVAGADAPAVHPEAGVLADAEVSARVALHRAGADDGSQIDFHVEPGNAVTIRTTVESDERRKALVAALMAIPHVRPEILIPGEAPPVPAASHGTAQTSSPIVRITTPALENVLEDLFPKKDDREEYVDGVLAESQAASTHAWELRRLIGRYIDAEIALLSRDSRAALEDLFRNHAELLNAAVERIAAKIRPLAGAAEAEGAPAASGASWRDLVTSFSDNALALHADLVEALSHSSGSMSAESLRAHIATRLRSLEIGLASRHREMDGDFLRE